MPDDNEYEGLSQKENITIKDSDGLDDQFDEEQHAVAVQHSQPKKWKRSME